MSVDNGKIDERKRIAAGVSRFGHERNVDGRPPRSRGTDGRVVSSVAASKVYPQPVRWLWRDRAPLGGLTLFAGLGGLGKSTATQEISARVTRGELVGDLQGEPATVLMVTLEDHVASVVVPRLIATGAD